MALSVYPPDIFPIQRRPTVWFLLARGIFGPVVRFLFRFDVAGRKNRIAGSCVLIANHLGWLDAFALLLSFPSTPRIHFLGNPEGASQNPFQWWVLRHVGGYLPVIPGGGNGPELYKAVYRCLDAGGIVALFPEGRFGLREGELLPFKSGFAHFAHHAGVPIIPVGLTGTKTLWLWKTVNVTIGEPFMPEGSIEETVEKGRESVLHLLRKRRWKGIHLFTKELTNLL
ncbi:MAG: lysophospholipid acyltransferase family protein [Candidatus Dormibacteria bacterium]